MAVVRRQFARIGAFVTGQLERQLDQLEQNIVAKFQADDAISFGPMRVTPLKTANYQAAPWDIVRCDPSGGAFAVLLPKPTDAAGAWILVKNDTSSTTAITVRCVDPAFTVDHSASISMTTAKLSKVLVPDPLGKNWMAI